MKFERDRFFPKQMDEGEEKRYGFPAIEEFERTYLPEVEKRRTKYWQKIKEHLAKARELRRQFFPVTPNDFSPIEGAVFELSLTERLLRNERYREGSRLRVDVDSRDLAKIEGGKARSKDPRKVHSDQNFLDQSIKVLNDCLETLLGEYAGQIGVDRESGEFKAWRGSIEGLANNLSAAFFQGAGNDQLEGLIDRKKAVIAQKREAMLGLATFRKIGQI
jgi:hypothetical protein